MARKAVAVEERRLEILMAPAALGISVDQACERFGWSKTQFYEFRKRYRPQGIAGLKDRSCRPRSSPRRTTAALERAICEMRVANPRWGPRRIRGELLRQQVNAPAASTIGRVLVRHGLVTPRPRKKRSFIRFERACPNDLWQIDAIEFALGDRSCGFIVNIVDDHARFLVASRACCTVDATAALETFQAAAEGYGVPRELLSDNARCFSGKNWGVVVELERALWALGVNTIASRPLHPQTLGKTERLHRTQREWIEDLGPLTSIDELQRRADAFRWHYNEQRPHQALGETTTPKERYEASVPAVPAQCPGRVVRRRVQPTGVVAYAGWQINVTTAWAGAAVEVHEQGGKITVTFGDELITVISAEEPKGFIGTGIRKGRPRKLPRRVPEAD